MPSNAAVTPNRSLLEKADLALSDLQTSGGLLQPAQAQRFIQLLIKEAVLMKEVTVVPMKSYKHLIDKIRFSGRVLRAGQEATALPVADRAKPDLSQTELDAKLFKAEVRLDNEVLEDSIERAQLRNTIMSLMAETISRDMEDVVINGDTTSADPFLAQFDGVIAQATSHTVAVGGAKLSKGVFRDCIKTMPQEYLRRKNLMRFYTSTDAELDYRDTLADRATAVGDKFLEGEAPVMASGVPLKAVPLFPENLGGGSNETVMLLTDPKNINVGIWRQIRFETDKLVSEGVLIIVATLRFDAKFAHEDAVVKATGITVS